MVILKVAMLALLSSTVVSLPDGLARKSDSLVDQEVIKKDIVIIGGGSSGTHAAISLKDQGFSTLVIEKKNRLGGNTETYIDPESGATLDYGVVFFHDTDVVQRYFARFNIPLSKVSAEMGQINYVDFQTGSPVNKSIASPEEMGDAFLRYRQIISQWPELEKGPLTFDPVPSDLLLPWQDFVEKHNLGPLITFNNEVNPGQGNPFTISTLEVAKLFNTHLIDASLAGFLATSASNNSLIYAAAQAELLSSDSLLLNSEVTSSTRNDTSISLTISTPHGPITVLAQRLLISIPPKPDIVSPFDLNPHETSIFSRFLNAAYYVAVFRNTGLSAGQSYFNADPNTPSNIQSLPGHYSITATRLPGHNIAYFGSERSSSSFPLSDTEVQAQMRAAIKTLQSEDTEPEMLAYSAHAPFYLQVSSQEAEKGFYRELWGIQGGRGTWWTGASWRAQDSSSLWRFNEEVVLPGLVEGLEKGW